MSSSDVPVSRSRCSVPGSALKRRSKTSHTASAFGYGVIREGTAIDGNIATGTAINPIVAAATFEGIAPATPSQTVVRLVASLRIGIVATLYIFDVCEFERELIRSRIGTGGGDIDVLCCVASILKQVAALVTIELESSVIL